MKEEKIVMIPFVAHESAMNRMERANKRLWIIIIVLVVAFFIYLLVPNEIIDETQSIEDTNNSEIHQSIGE